MTACRHYQYEPTFLKATLTNSQSQMSIFHLSCIFLFPYVLELFCYILLQVVCSCLYKTYCNTAWLGVFCGSVALTHCKLKTQLFAKQNVPL